jgi:hypothetical protein
LSATEDNNEGTPIDADVPVGGKRAVARVTAEVRRARVWDLRQKGFSVRQIAKQLGVGKNVVQKDITLLLNEWRQNNVDVVDEYIFLDTLRLEHAYRALLPRINTGDTWAIKMFLEISAHRLRLLGGGAIKIETKAQIQQQLSGLNGAPVAVEAMIGATNEPGRMEAILNILAEAGVIPEAAASAPAEAD